MNYLMRVFLAQALAETEKEYRDTIATRNGSSANRVKYESASARFQALQNAVKTILAFPRDTVAEA